MESKRYKKIVQASAIYDLIVSAPFATPWTFKWLHHGLGYLVTLPEYQPMHMLFANLMGSVVVVWSTLRLRQYNEIFGLYDGIARLLFFTWQMYYLIGFQAPWIVGVFALFEITFGILQLGFRKKISET
ncbi:hypothetical protein QJS83_07465 [Bdellovibrio sp. 22V]|uniref:hypothetical protein n=1 Tax=Bdellovibrio TaxID=958 RepID=UPI002543E912|nr:hypothetical protein [Bdellovibrio sp. 22V]WII73712.1 hypothetical protein QJS83_07465 [Bdellovibrio sp. 22V]